jgi:hypothetical protein
VRPGNFPIGSPGSRAVARLLVQRQESERKQAWLGREKAVFAFPIFRPDLVGHNSPYRSEWYESADGSKKLYCILWVPLDMSIQEAGRIVFPEGL